MSSLMELITTRRSTRSFLDRKVPDEKIARIVEAARYAPSACHSQPWRFVAVTDPALLERATGECLGPPVPNRWAAGAPALLVACAERKLVPNYLGEPAAGVAYHQIDLGIAMEHVVLRARELGLGTCYIGWFRARKLKGLLNIPRHWKVVCLLALGYPGGGEDPPMERLPLEDILFFNRLSGEE